MNSQIADIKLIAETLPLNSGLGYSESCYSTLLKHILTKKGYVVRQEVLIPFIITDPSDQEKINFGFGRADLVVETDQHIIIIELKANVGRIESAKNQLRRYILHYPHSDKHKLGLLLMFNAVTRHNRWPCWTYSTEIINEFTHSRIGNNLGKKR